MKTIKQWLEEIPDEEIREKALNNMWKEYGQEWSKDLNSALKRAFLWHRSPEGYDYWKKISEEQLYRQQAADFINELNINYFG